MAYTIRTATPNDLPFLRDMLYESIFTPKGTERPERSIIDDPSLAKYVEGWGRETDIGYMALDSGGRPIGSVTTRFLDAESKGYGFVDESIPELGIAIIREYRGQGVGTALLKAIFEELKNRGIGAVSLSVDSRNPAKRLYERFGFMEVGHEGQSIVMLANLL